MDQEGLSSSTGKCIYNTVAKTECARSLSRDFEKLKQ